MGKSINGETQGEDGLELSLRPAGLEVCRGAASFLQSDFWGNFKARFGWKPFAFTLSRGLPSDPPGDGESAAPLLVLCRRLGPGLSMAYVPWGPPLVHGGDAAPKTAAAAARQLRFLLPGNAAFIRFDFPWIIEDPAAVDIRSAPGYLGAAFTRAAADVQPPDTVVVDLTREEGAILGNMKSKWRYNIGLAEKKGVAVRRMDIRGAEDLAGFYRVYRETADRDGIAIHGVEYYAALFEEAAKHGVDTRLYMASHEGEDLAGIVTLFRGREAVYLYGASASHKRNLMAPYALQWRAIRDARAAGCLFYDLYGIPPRPPEEEPDHPMAGLYRFKTGFIGDALEGGEQGVYPGGRIIHRAGSWDYPCRPLAAALYGGAEKARKKLWDLKKRLKRR
ncbi:MAG: peptidoglycan bridge formation glycyltransferase FemA/FemB family protein [Treponema sp.]|jgi:lipid II:glycine glycyltransferase (peptidoglycan interpeptide bridge formation enzyme)|nr:peptidoglycan bridge formation glycyltransferase FemA/FemB family protein [Treponema sp.]